MSPPTPYAESRLWPVTTLTSAVQIWPGSDMSDPGGGAGTCAGMSGDQFAVFTNPAPITINAMTTVTLMATTMLLAVADSETPKVNNSVTATMPMSAGRFTMPMTCA